MDDLQKLLKSNSTPAVTVRCKCDVVRKFERETKGYVVRCRRCGWGTQIDPPLGRLDPVGTVPNTSQIETRWYNG